MQRTASTAIELPSKKPTNGSALFMSAIAAKTKAPTAAKAAAAAVAAPPPRTVKKKRVSVSFPESEEDDDADEGEEEEEEEEDEEDGDTASDGSGSASEEDALAAAIAAAEPKATTATAMSIDEMNGYPRIPDVDLPTPAASDDENAHAAGAASASWGAASVDDEENASNDAGVAALMKARLKTSKGVRKQNVAHAHIRRLLHAKCPKITTISFDGGKTEVDMAKFLTTCEIDTAYSGYNKLVGNVSVQVKGPQHIEPGKKAPAMSFRRLDEDGQKGVFTSQFGFGSCKTFCKEWERAFIAELIKDSSAMSTDEAEKQMNKAYDAHMEDKPVVSDVAPVRAHKPKRRRVAMTAAVVEPGDSDADTGHDFSASVTREDVAKFMEVGCKILMQMLAGKNKE